MQIQAAICSTFLIPGQTSPFLYPSPLFFTLHPVLYLIAPILSDDFGFCPLTGLGLAVGGSRQLAGNITGT